MNREDTPRIDRRTVLKTTGLLAVAGVGTGFGLTAFAGRAAAAIPDFTISGDTVTTDDGSLTDVKVKASGDWTFDGIDIPEGHNLGGVRVGLNVNFPGSAHAQGYTATSQWIPVSGNPNAASGTFDLPWGSLPFDRTYFPGIETFESDVDGESKSTTLEAHLWIDIRLNGPSGPRAVPADDMGWGAHRTSNFVVTVNNQAATATVTGEGETLAEGENEYPLGEGEAGELRLVWSTGECKWRVDNTNPAGTAPVPFTLAGVGGDGSVAGVAHAGHYGYPTSVGPNGHDPHGLYVALDTSTAKLLVDGDQVDTKARGGCQLD